jgi:uncharacterized small protein (DUF1192 family)
MSLNLHLSDEELKALLGPQRDKPDDGGIRLPEERPESALPAMPQEIALLHALKDAVKTLTVRVASLESEVGRLRAELAVARRGGELPPAGERIVVEGVALPALSAGREAAAGAETAPREAGEVPVAAHGAGVSGAAGKPAVPAPAEDEDAAAVLKPRASRHRKPKKKGFFSRIFDR